MNEIAPGTPCYLVNLVEMRDLCGRVVEVVAGPMFSPEFGDWRYAIDAAWAREMWPGRPVTAPREHLLPIAPPPARAASEGENAESFGAGL